MSDKKTICIFCSSSNSIPDIYFTETEKLGTLLASAGYDLVYGAGNLGLMGSIANAFKKHNRSITGIIPQKLNEFISPFEGHHEIVITKTMSERKDNMIEKAYGFVTLPGGFGTLEEILEVITLKQLGYIDKPITILNTNGFYDNLLLQLETIYKERFAKESNREIYFVSKDQRNS